jgi:hypothetical protein
MATKLLLGSTLEDTPVVGSELIRAVESVEKTLHEVEAELGRVQARVALDGATGGPARRLAKTRDLVLLTRLTLATWREMYGVPRESG